MLADVVIDKDLFRGNEQNRSLLKMSRVHFEVNWQKGRAALLDKSSNGTYINKVRVGKEKSSRLAHLDEIGVLECDLRQHHPLLLYNVFVVLVNVKVGSRDAPEEDFQKFDLKQFQNKIEDESRFGVHPKFSFIVVVFTEGAMFQFYPIWEFARSVRSGKLPDRKMLQFKI